MWICNFFHTYFKVYLHSVAPEIDCCTMELFNIFFLKIYIFTIWRNLLLMDLKKRGMLFRSGETPWREKKSPRLPFSERSQLSFLQMLICCLLKQCCVVRALPKCSFSLDLANVSVCPTRSCFHFFKLCYYCFASLEGGLLRKLIKFIRH